jgi:hypothetical protein
MKFNLPEKDAPLLEDQKLRLGNVYSCKGGGKTAYWIVVGIGDRSVNLLGINLKGQVSSTANYGQHVFESARFNREVIGRCEGIDDLEFDITWMESK